MESKAIWSVKCDVAFPCATQFELDEKDAAKLIENGCIGVFEGAVTYATGAYRATSNSIMNQNTDGFNAPSRYAIWYRINKLAYGVEWSGTYEDFVTWDLAHQAVTRSAKVSKAKGIKRELPPLASPVFVKR